METVGERKFVEVPGEKQHELPPLFVTTATHLKRLDRVVGMANDLIDSEEMIAPQAWEGVDPDLELELDRRKMDLALNLVDQYVAFVNHWQWGNAVLDWIRQCEITFDSRTELRHLLATDIWPHAGRCSFVALLADKAVRPQGYTLEEAVGLRLTFRQPPPLKCFSDQFLLFLNSSVATTAYQTWARMNPPPVAALPPERFTFQVVTM